LVNCAEMDGIDQVPISILILFAPVIIDK